MPRSNDIAGPPRLIDRVRQTIRARHYSLRTEKAYIGWIRRFIFFYDKQHPANLGTPEVVRFLEHLATVQHVAASTQNQAFSALLFLYMARSWRRSLPASSTSFAPRGLSGCPWCSPETRWRASSRA